LVHAYLFMVIFRKRVAGLSTVALNRFVASASAAACLRGTTNVMITSSREMRTLNRRFRRKDRATDVLSFPPLLGTENGFAGDVAISAEIAVSNARRLGHTAADEIRILTLHGILHLAGYDHEEDSGEMARKEQRLRKALGLPGGLIQRNASGSKQSESTKAPRRLRPTKAAFGAKGKKR
jgi:probable rRNA maturation factor